MTRKASKIGKTVFKECVISWPEILLSLYKLLRWRKESELNSWIGLLSFYLMDLLILEDAIYKTSFLFCSPLDIIYINRTTIISKNTVSNFTFKQYHIFKKPEIISECWHDTQQTKVQVLRIIKKHSYQSVSSASLMFLSYISYICKYDRECNSKNPRYRNHCKIPPAKSEPHLWIVATQRTVNIRKANF